MRFMEMNIMLCMSLLLVFSTFLHSSSGLSSAVVASSELKSSRHLLHFEDKDTGDSKDEKSKDIVDVDPKDKAQGEEALKNADGVMKMLQVDENTGFTHAFIASLSVIIVSELGDKTFFIAAIMAMTHSRLTVLIGALMALFVMTFLSAMVGFAATVIPRALTYYVSSALFAIFGVKMLREGYNMSDDEGKEEYEEVQADLKRREDELNPLMDVEEEEIEEKKLDKQNTPVQDIETGIIRTPGRRFLTGILSTVFLQSFTLTFLAEWGDRSQIATIILGAREDVFGVIVGGCLGHSLCTGLAVLGGRFVAQRISVRTVTIIGGVVFLIFALSAFYFGP